MREERLARSLRKKGWKIGPKKLKDSFGECNWKQKRISIDVDACIAHVIVHELIHAEFGRHFPEEVVRALEIVRVRKLTHKEERRLVKLLGVEVRHAKG